MTAYMEKKTDGGEKNFFRFEEDFIEANIRCIPMIVRFKLDACGIKLKLAEWSKMSAAEREDLAALPCKTELEINHYRKYLTGLILSRTGKPATDLQGPQNKDWSQIDEIPTAIVVNLFQYSATVSIKQWKRLSDLQRFALLKLSNPGHENKNFPKAMVEFGLC